MIVPAYPVHVSSSGNFYGSEIRRGIFGGFNFGPGIFLGFDFCNHSIIPVTWNQGYGPRPRPSSTASKNVIPFRRISRGIQKCSSSSPVFFFFCFSTFCVNISRVYKASSFFKVIIRGRREAISFVMAQHALFYRNIFISYTENA